MSTLDLSPNRPTAGISPPWMESPGAENDVIADVSNMANAAKCCMDINGDDVLSRATQLKNMPPKQVGNPECNGDAWSQSSSAGTKQSHRIRCIYGNLLCLRSKLVASERP